jgi:hypothetical protein
MRISTGIGSGLAAFAIVVMVAIVPFRGDRVGSRPRSSITAPASATSVPTKQAAQRSTSATEQPPSTPKPTWAPAPSVDPALDDDLALAGRDGVPGRLYCSNGRTFDFEDLQNPTGAETMSGPEFDILRSSIGNPPTREVARDETGVTFLADDRYPGPWEHGRYLWVDVDRAGASWKWSGAGDCEPRAWAPPGYGAATWRLDPAFRRPGPTTQTLHVLVSEWACSSGRSAHGRIGPAYVTYDAFTVRIELLVRSLPGDQDCAGVAATPARLRLSEPLGHRTLKDLNAHLLSGTGG